MEKISLNKKYQTISGKEVVLHDIKMKNYAGNIVTFPVKGTIFHSKRKKEYQIWTIDGRNQVPGITDKDLVEVKIE
jgi:hypothetical protein